MGFAKKNAPGCCGCKKKGCVGVHLCWSITDCLGDSFDQADFSATVRGPDGKPVGVSIHHNPGLSTVCIDVQTVGDYSITIRSRLTFDHTETTTVAACQSLTADVSVQPNRFRVTVNGCPWATSPTDGHMAIGGAAVQVSNGFASGSGTTDGTGVALIQLAGTAWPASAVWSVSASKDRYATLTTGYNSFACSAVMNLTPAPCYGCPDCDVAGDESRSCPEPQFASGTLITPFGAVCLVRGVPSIGQLTVSTMGVPQVIRATDVSCFQPIQAIQAPVSCNVPAANGFFGNGGCIQVGTWICSSSSFCDDSNGVLTPTTTPRAGPPHGSYNPADIPLQVSIRVTKKSCEPFTLRGSYKAPDGCSGLQWANGDYTYIADGCGCSGSYGTGEAQSLAMDEPSSFAATLDRPSDLSDGELVIARYTEDVRWSEDLAA